MKFGHVETNELDKLDLSLPKDPVDNSKVLGGKKTKHPKVYIGCGKWGRDEWVGMIYPKGTKSGDYLKNYINHFNSIELNGTFYQTRKGNIESWASLPDGDFKFCPKFSRRISHIKRLKTDDDSKSWYIDSISAFGETLGLPFLQMPDNFAPKYLDRLKEFVETPPNNLPYALELRHEEWFSDKEVQEELFPFLQKNNITLVITDTAGRRDCIHQRLTTKQIFVRFNGYDLHPSDYQRLDDWVERLSDWFDQGLEEAYFFMHQKDERNTIMCADYMVKKMNEKLGLSLRAPQFVD